MTALKLCIFDCDGTLVDGCAAIATAMAQAFSGQGLPAPTAAAVKRVVGLALVDAIRLLHPGAPAEAYGALADGYVAAFAALRRGGATREWLFPGVMEGLRDIEEAGWLLGMATGKSQRGALATLAAHDLHRRFVTLQTADRAPGKPAPDMILRALAETGVAPRRAVMVGDTTYDMQMAKNAGIVAVGVDWGYHHRDELLAAGAIAVIEDFAALPALVDDVVASAA
jgi:phosphoglycolate phosphatase